jgi:MFS transporter, putative metabolite:H+ symporter
MRITTSENVAKKSLLTAAVFVAALGYFVDIYDLLLFSIVRVPSLKSLGFTGQTLTDHGIFLLNVQMIGLLLGGICWGILGDKKGRLYVLFGSIFLYSVANICNGFVHSIEAYSVWRFVAGFGLAGELGAGITLVAEIMPKEKRGYATTMVAAVGVSGAVVGFFVAELFNWRTSFFVGGGLGLSLLLLRIGVAESGMFGNLKKENHRRGDFFSLFSNGKKLLKYLRCIVIRNSSMVCSWNSHYSVTRIWKSIECSWHCQCRCRCCLLLCRPGFGRYWQRTSEPVFEKQDQGRLYFSYNDHSFYCRLFFIPWN